MLYLEYSSMKLDDIVQSDDMVTLFLAIEMSTCIRYALFQSSSEVSLLLELI